VTVVGIAALGQARQAIERPHAGPLTSATSVASSDRGAPTAVQADPTPVAPGAASAPTVAPAGPVSAPIPVSAPTVTPTAVAANSTLTAASTRPGPMPPPIVPDPPTVSGPPATAALASFPTPPGASNRESDDRHLLQFEVDLNIDAAVDWYRARLTQAGYTVAPPDSVQQVFPARTLNFTTPASPAPTHRGSVLLTTTPSKSDHSVVLVVVE
jgi:hypothetical protein